MRQMYGIHPAAERRKLLAQGASPGSEVPRARKEPRRGDTNRWAALALIVILGAAGCQQKMANQPSYRPLDPSDFFDDGRASRPLVAGTVARGHLRTDTALYTGRKNPFENPPLNAPGNRRESYEEFVDTFPFTITSDVLEHGRNRYMIFCTVCHDPAGTGQGKIVERGYTRPPSYHNDRLRNVPVGHIFAVITEGYGSMPSYAAQIPPRDRWAITAYIRALQASQHFAINDLPDDMRREWEKAHTKNLAMDRAKEETR